MKPNKKYGFRKFIRRVEGKNPNPNPVYCTLPPLEIYSIEAIEATLNGKYYEIAHGFPWRSSPQGADFWALIQTRHTAELPEEAKNFLKYLLDKTNHVKTSGDGYIWVSLKNWIMRDPDNEN